MDLIYTNQNREDIGVLQDFSLDLAFGSGENDFELTVSRENNVADSGCYIYIQGTEYGGIIDAVKSDTVTAEVTYSGRTWHGILNSKILEPDSGQAYLTVSGDTNTVLSTLIVRMGLGALFQALSTPSGITVKTYQFDRYVSGYNGILKMLKTVGAKLRIVHDGTNVVVSAVPVTDYTQDGVSDDQTALTVLKTKNKVNHLICLGTGELADRMVVHLYADAAGNISRTQTFTGLEEYTAVYDYSSVESEEDLISGGTERFRELLQQDQLDVNFPESDDIYDVGDIVGATDNVTGISIAVPVTKKIVKIEGDLVSVAIETNTESVSAQASTGGGGSSGGSEELIAGSGIAVEGRKISTVAAPHNLLDNSDFRNPVAQAGIPGMHGTMRYAIDRWIANTATVTQQKNCLRASGETWTVELRQYIDDVSTLHGKTLTFAVKLRSPMTNVYIGVFPSDNNGFIDGTYRTLWFNASTDWSVALVQCTIPAEATALYVAINNPNEGVDNYYEVEWAALYEGAYTADTLPKYQPKGYAAEELECKRYFGRIDSWSIVPGVITWENKLTLTVPYPVKMRVNPTATVAKGSIIVDGEYININETPSAVVSYYGYLNVRFDTAITGSHTSRSAVFAPSDTALYFNADL